jgi:hypothetical protein
MFGNVEKLKFLLDELRGLNVIVEERTLVDFANLRKARIISDLERTTLMEELSLRQKSRAQWLREGDEKSILFHRMANSNSRNNTVESLDVNGPISSNITEIRDHIL